MKLRLWIQHALCQAISAFTEAFRMLEEVPAQWPSGQAMILLMAVDVGPYWDTF